MSLPQEIQDALLVYDKNKGFWRRLFRRDQAAIRALRTLNEAEQTNLLKIYQCFIVNLPKPTQASYQVYQAVLVYFTQIDFSGIPDTIDELHAAKLLKPENLDKLTKLKGNHFRLLANLLKQLKDCQLLNQTNFGGIANHFATSDENISVEFSIIASAVDILRNKLYLNQENFDTLLENPNIAVNIASALMVLGSSELLIPTNRSKLLNAGNQFLMSDDAFNLVWIPLDRYLPTLDNPQEKQWVFDQIIAHAQKQNPAEEIENYMKELTSGSSVSRKHNDVKYNTAPSASRRHSQDDLDDLDQSTSQLTRQPTI